MLDLAAFARRIRLGVLLSMIVASGAAAHAAEPLVWTFKPGLTNRYRMTQDTNVTKTGAGGEVKVNSSLTIDMSWTVERVNDDGSAVLQQKIDRMRIKASTGEGQQAEIDSAAKEEPQGQAAMLTPFLKAITSNPFTVTMTPRGEITAVEVPDAIVEALKNQPGAAQMGDLATAEGFKKLVSQAAFVLPEKLEPGVEWSRKTEAKLPAIGTQIAETTYRYEGEKEIDGEPREVIGAKVNVKFTGGEVPVEVAKQESKGEIHFNREVGRLESSNIEQKTVLKITVSNQIVEQTIEQSVEMERRPDTEE